MRAARIHQFGGLDKVELEEVRAPRLKRGEALIRVRAAGVNPVDWMICEKIYNPKGADKVPLTLGQDFSGVIENIAPGSQSPFRKGDEVFGEVWGSFAEWISAPLKDLVKKPRQIDFLTAAALPMPGLTAWQMVIDTAHAKRGMKFLIHGVSGGVGSLAAQFAKWRGAVVYGTASRPSFGYLESIGLDGIIDYHRERFEERVRDVDVVIDPLGGETQARSWPVLKKGGMLINLIGEIDRRAARKYGVKGVEFGMEYDVDDLGEIAKLVARGIVKPHISKVLPLGSVKRALDLNEEGKSHGKIILKVA